MDRDTVIMEKCQVGWTHAHTHHSAKTLSNPLLTILVPVTSCLCPQASFIDFVVYPLWEVWAELVFPHAQFVLDRLHAMQEYWTDMIPTSPNHLASTDEDSAELDRSPPHTPLVEGQREPERCLLSGYLGVGMG